MAGRCKVKGVSRAPCSGSKAIRLQGREVEEEVGEERKGIGKRRRWCVHTFSVYTKIPGFVILVGRSRNDARHQPSHSFSWPTCFSLIQRPRFASWPSSRASIGSPLDLLLSLRFPFPSHSLADFLARVPFKTRAISLSSVLHVSFLEKIVVVRPLVMRVSGWFRDRWRYLINGGNSRIWDIYILFWIWKIKIL